MEEVSNIFKGALPNSATSRTHPHFPQSPPTTQSNVLLTLAYPK